MPKSQLIFIIKMDTERNCRYFTDDGNAHKIYTRFCFISFCFILRHFAVDSRNIFFVQALRIT